MDLHGVVAAQREELESVKLAVVELCADYLALKKSIELLTLNLNNLAASADFDLLESLPASPALATDPQTPA